MNSKSVATHLVLLLASTVGSGLSVEHANPGFRAILTSKGLNYAHTVGLRVLKEWLCNYTIPTQNLTGRVGHANITYNLSEWNIHSLDFGESYLTSDTRGLVLSVKDFSISFSTDFLVNETDWPHWIDKGSGEVSVSGVSLTISVDLLVNRTGSSDEDGHFALNVTTCSFSVDNINVLFSGGTSYVYNLFGPALNGFIRRELNKKGCKKLIKWFNKMAHKYVDPLPTTIKITDGIEIDYSMVSEADFSRRGRVVTNHKGEFLLLMPNATHPPFTPPPLPDPSDEEFPKTKMIHIVVSKYVAETAAYVFKEAGKLAYNITSSQLWVFKKTEMWCASTFVPEVLCQHYPNNNVMLGIEVSDTPTLNITPGHTSLEAEVEITMFVDNGSGIQNIAFALELHAQADVVPSFKEEMNHICGTVQHARIVDIRLKNSTIGEFNISMLRDVISNVLLPLGVSYVNFKYTEPGFPIPAKDGITFSNTTITEKEGYIVVSGDISYEPTFLKTNMTCIYDWL